MARRVLACLLTAALAVLGLTVAAVPAVADDRGPITLGTPTTLDLAAGESATYTFTGVADRHITLLAQSPTPLDVAISGPDGIVLPGLTVGGFVGPFDDTPLITRAGTWSITFGAWGSEPVSAQVTLRLVADQTGTITPGAAGTRTFGEGGQDARLAFQGTAGKRLVVRITASDLTPPPGSPYGGTANFWLTRPGSTTPEWIGAASSIPGYIEVPELPVSGGHTLTVDPSYGSTGSITFGLYQPTDATGTLTPGTARTVSITTPGQRTALTFAGVVGARVTVRVGTAGEIAGAGAQIGLRRPGSSESESLFGGAFREGPVIDQAGTWTLTAGPSNVGATGTVTVTLVLPTDVQRTVTPGTATPLTIATAGQNARLGFQAQQGQKVTLTVASPTWTATGPEGPEPGQVRYSVTNAAGESLPLELPETTGTAVSPSLPAGGQWFVTVDPVGDATGSATLTVGLGRVRTAALTVGQPATTQLALGDSLEYTFTGTAGRRLNFSVTAADWRRDTGEPLSGRVQFTLLAPDGRMQVQETVREAPYYTETREPLSQSGTWRLRLDPVGDTTGSHTVVVRQPVDVTGTITSGASRTVNLPTPGQRALFTFTGAVGQRATLEVTSQSWRSAMNGGGAGSGAAGITWVRPDGQTFGHAGLGSGSRAFAESEPLDMAGTWTAILDPQGDTAGSLTGIPRLLRDVNGGTLASGASKQVNLPDPGQRIRYAVDVKAGDSVGLELTRASWTSATGDPEVLVTLRPPDGSWWAAQQFRIGPGTTSPAWLLPENGSRLLQEAGTWTLEIDPQGATEGSQTFALHVRTPVTGTLTSGQAKKVTLSQKGQDAEFTMPAQENVEYRYAISGSTFAAASLHNVHPWQTESYEIPRGASSGSLVRPDDGEPLRLRIDPSGPATGSLTITVTAVPLG